VFVFHQANVERWQPLVRPPRLGGNRKVGVFASRSPFRPNPIVMSAVRLSGIEHTESGPVLHLLGVDLVDGTPVLDIKPYIPYADAIEGAQGGFAEQAPEPVFSVIFSEEADTAVTGYAKRIPDLRDLIVHMLEHDPRPAYFESRSNDPSRIFGIRLFDWDVKWRVDGDAVHVLALDNAEG
jgi:tRNA (adenine37-N6)-methyltransferase